MSAEGQSDRHTCRQPYGQVVSAGNCLPTCSLGHLNFNGLHCGSSAPGDGKREGVGGWGWGVESETANTKTSRQRRRLQEQSEYSRASVPLSFPVPL